MEVSCPEKLNLDLTSKILCIRVVHAIKRRAAAQAQQVWKVQAGCSFFFFSRPHFLFASLFIPQAILSLSQSSEQLQQQQVQHQEEKEAQESEAQSQHAQLTRDQQFQ